jgi:HlyD family secretion protein
MTPDQRPDPAGPGQAEGAAPLRLPPARPAARGASGEAAARPAGRGTPATAGAGRPGRPAWSARRPVVAGLLALGLLFGGFGSWAVFARLNSAVIATGAVEIDLKRQTVQHPDGGVVAEILVAEGSTVAAGDVLLRLEGQTLRSELAIVESQFFDVIARRARLEAERDGAAEIRFPPLLTDQAAARPEVAELIAGQERFFADRAETLRQQIANLEHQRLQIAGQIDGIDAQTAALARQRDLVEEELAAQQELLDRMLAQQARVLALRREIARLDGSIGALTAERAQAEARNAEIALQILLLRATRRDEAQERLRDLDGRELELAERRRALGERVARLDLRAPVAGVVHGLAVTTPQAVVRPAEPLMNLVPQDRPFVVAVQVAPTDIDQVWVGQEGRISFPVFGLRDMPELRAQVTLVSADAFVDERVQASFYRVELAPIEGELAKLGENRLVPGMPVDAFIQTGARSPLAYLVEPLTHYFERALREN